MLQTIPISEISPSHFKDFSCGVEALDEFLTRYARGNHKKGIGKTFVVLQEDRVVGYYTVSMGSIEHLSLPLEVVRGLPRYPVPAARIGRLAVDNKMKKNGLGAFLLVDALRRILVVSQSIGTYFVVVDAKSHEAKKFYERFGFIALTNEPLLLVLPIASLSELF